MALTAVALALPPDPQQDGPAVLLAERTDEGLLARVAEGDAEAFEALYDRFARAVFSLCVRVLGDRGRAEDAAQEVFTSIWRAARSFDSARGNASGWIFAIARNAATDAARRKSARPIDSAPETADPGPAPDERALSAADAFRLHTALDILPQTEREVIDLAYFGGLSQSEIAERLHTPLGTVKTRTRSALRRLATELGADW